MDKTKTEKPKHLKTVLTGTETEPDPREIMSLLPKDEASNRQEGQTLSFEHLVDRVMRNSGIPEKWISKRFSDLTGEDGYLKVIERIRSWDFKTPAVITILSKANGVGKTHVGVCLIRKYIYSYLSQLIKSNPERDLTGVFFNNIFVYDSTLYRRVQESYRDRSPETETQIINELTQKPFLVIDDLFSARDNEFARKIILDIINLRVDWYNLPTFITSNLTRKEIENIDPRIDSRLSNGLVIEINPNAEDRRGAKK